jgi:hypothetical protein
MKLPRLSSSAKSSCQVLSTRAAEACIKILLDLFRALTSSAKSRLQDVLVSLNYCAEESVVTGNFSYGQYKRTLRY